MSATGPTHCRPEAYQTFAAALPRVDHNDGFLRAAVAMSMHELEGIRPDDVEDAIQRMADSVRSRLHSDNEAALVAHAHALLFEEIGFRGNTEDYYDPANSYLPVVLRRKIGIPITLSLVYKLVLEKLGLHVDGINSPGHFLARVSVRDKPMLVDPFAQGRALSVSDARHLIAQALGRPGQISENTLPVATHREWLSRMLRNLHAVFRDRNRPADAGAMVELAHLLKSRKPGAEDVP